MVNYKSKPGFTKKEADKTNLFPLKTNDITTLRDHGTQMKLT